jgi:hypothetical protein
MAKNTIYLGPIDQFDHALHVEGLAVDAFLPGTLVKRVAGGLETTDKAATVFDNELLVAREKGEGEGQSVTTAYTIGDTALAVKLRSGEMVYARVADAQAITAKGTPLSSNADGTLKIAVVPATVGATSEQILFYAEEVITTSGVELVKVSAA